MISHDEIYDALIAAFPSQFGSGAGPAVKLLARYDDENLELPAGAAHVFLPDCHMLTPDDASRFTRFAFDLAGDLERLLRALTDLAAAHPRELSFYQLGDLFDLWRTLGGGGDKVETNAIAAHFTRIITLLRSQQPEGLDATILAGNHDFALREHGEWLAPRFLGIGGRRHPGGKALILHGDAFDFIERLPDGLQSFFVRLLRSRRSGRRDMGEIETDIVREVNRGLSRSEDADLFGEGQPLGTPWEDDLDERFDTVNGSSGGSKRFFRSALSLAEEGGALGEDIRLVVIGHTHLPRIVAGTRDDGSPFALMDCGAWVGNFTPPGAASPVMKAQIGVIVGNDLRVYQVGSRPANGA